MKELLRTAQLLVGQALDLISAFFDFLGTSFVALQTPTFIGITVVAFLLGLLLGRISKHEVPHAPENPEAGDANRVVLDLERLTPLGLSLEEEEGPEVMDISSLRTEKPVETPSTSDPDRQFQSETAPQRSSADSG